MRSHCFVRSVGAVTLQEEHPSCIRPRSLIVLMEGGPEERAFLFEEEVVANVTLSAGWNDLQVKSLSHYSTVAGWQVQANVATNASSGCVIDACGQNILAAMCADVP